MDEAPASSVARISAGYALQQYQAYLQDLGNIGTRYTTANGFYLSIITALLGILSLTKSGESMTSAQGLLRLAVPFFAALVCWVWSRSMAFYDAIFAAKFDVLREMETYAGLFTAYKNERDHFLEQRKGWLVKGETWISRLLMALFLVIFIGAALMR